MDDNYLQINNLQDVDFQLILNDYIENFTRKYLVVETNYKKVNEFEVRFDKRDLHHILGLHKVKDKKNNATSTLSEILEGNLTLEKIRKHRNFNDIKNRLLCYNFLHHCFIDKSIKLCVIVQNNPNPQNLDIVFIDTKNNKNILLGLKKVRGQEYYVPTTMYVINDSSVYHQKRKSNIKSIEWFEY